MSETLRDLVVSLSLDSDNFSRNLSSINKQITEAESRFKAAGAGVSGFETSAAGLGAQLNMLQQKQALQSKAVDQYQRALTSANTKLTDSVARHDKLKASLEQAKAKQTELGTAVAKASQYYDKQKAALGENDSATIAAKENLDALKGEYSAAGEEVKKLEGQLKASDKAMQNAADGVSKAETNLNHAQAALRETEAEIGRVNARLAAARSSWLSAAVTLEKLGNKALAAGKNMTALGKSLSMKVTAPVVALGASAVKTFASFDDAMRQVQATMNASAEDTAKLTAAAKNMGIATRYTASEAANALNYLALAGYDANKAISALSTVLNLAQAGSIDLATSSDMVTDSMAALGLNMGQMSDFSDQMARTAQKSNTNIAQLGEAILTVGGTAKVMAGGTAELNASLGVLANRGIKGAEGGTMLRNLLLSLQAPTSDAQKRFKELNLDVFDASGNLRALDDIFQDLNNAMAGKTGEERTGILADIFNKRDLKAAEAMLAGVGVEFDKLMGEINASKGAAAQMATTMEGGLGGSLRSLKSAAEGAAISFGEALAPTVKDSADWLTGATRAFASLSDETKTTIIQTALFAATLGPAILVLGKLNTGFGNVAIGAAKFIKSVANAGSAAGALKAVGSGVATLLGPVGIAALAAAALYGAYRWIDYASGAKEARDALEGMNQTAKTWKETQAETLFDRSAGMSALGLSEADFSADMGTAQKWMDRLKAVWSDGKKETDEIVASFSGQFRSFNDTTKGALKELADNAEKAGLSDSGVFKDLDADMKKLDDMSSELDGLLKKRQNGTLTGKDKTRIQELIDAREAIEVKYNLTPADTSGFSKIVEKVNAEVARAQAEGKDGADVSVYENAVKAAAEGMAAINTQLQERYADEYALIQLLDDEREKEAALATLNEKHNADRTAAAQEYANALAQVMTPAWESESNQKAIADVEKLGQLIQQYQLANDGEKSGILTQMKELGEGMDEGALASYLAMLTQIQDLQSQGLSPDEIKALFPQIDVASMLGGYASIAEFLKANAGDLSGLNTMFNEALPEETRRVLVELDMTAAETRWAQFEKDTAAITTVATVTPPASGIDVIINTYKPTADTLVTPPPSMVEALISAYNAAVGAGVQKPDTQVEALISAYTESGDATVAYPSGQVEALIGSYKEAVGAGVANPSTEIVAQVGAYIEKAGASVALPSEAVTAFIAQYTAAVGAGVQEPNEQVDAFIASYQAADGATVAVPTETVNALIGAYLASDTASVEAPESVTAVITAYTGAENASVPQLSTTASVTLNSLDAAAIENFKAANQITGLQGYVGAVGLMPNAAQTFKDKFDAGLLALYGSNGLPIPVTPESVASLNANDIVHGVTVDDAGNATLHVQIVPEVGSPEAVELAETNLNDKPDNFLPDWMKSSTADKVAAIQNLAQSARELEAAGEAWSAQGARSMILDQLMSIIPDDLQNIATYIANAMAALESGELDPEAAAKVEEQINAMLAVVQQTDQYLGVGNDISAGIAQGLTGYGWAAEASTLASAIETALRSATQTHSPSGMTKPVGTGLSEGIAQGMTGFGFAAAGSSVASNVKSGVGDLNKDGRTIGQNFSRGVANGITSGTSWIRTAARNAALAAKQAAQSALQEASPSRVGKQIGSFFTKGIALGVGDEKELRAVRNAARFIGTSLDRSTYGSVANDNRKTYHQNQSVTVNVDSMAVRDTQDIYALALEIDALKRRVLRGKGG